MFYEENNDSYLCGVFKASTNTNKNIEWMIEIFYKIFFFIIIIVI